MRGAPLKLTLLITGFAVAGCSSSSPSNLGDGRGGSSATTGGSAGSTGLGGSSTSSGGAVVSSGGSSGDDASSAGQATGAAGAAGSASASGGSANSGGAAGNGAVAGGGASTGGAAGALNGGAGAALGGGGNATGGSSGAGGANGAAGGGGGAAGAGGAAMCPPTYGAPSSQVIRFNDDGGWCWYQDERVIVDTTANKLVLGSVATGSSRNGRIEVVMHDLATGTTTPPSSLGKLNPDDHNAPALMKLGEGKYLAMYTTHNDDCFTYYNIYDAGKWGPQQKFDWKSYGCPTPNNKTVSYSNIWLMGGKVWDFVRSVETSPNLITSSDGATWTYTGRLTSTPRVGYVAGYYKYWGNNSDRIDFLATEAHPRDDDTSLYHGYIKDGKSYTSTGTEVDTVTDKNAPDITKFTKVFGTGTSIGGVKLNHLWNCDLVRYEDGTVAMIGSGRVEGSYTPGTADDNMDPDKRFIYARFDGTSWKATYLTHAGNKLYSSEADYTGLGALHPNDPHTIYISTAWDPRDDKTKSAKREIWRGTTCDNGASFTWTPITQNSSKDQLRPVVPYWPGDKTALLWERGDYNSAQTYKTEIVGLILDGR